MGKKIIGAIGKNGSGKDTILDIIVEEYDVPIISIGDMVRNIAREKGVKLTRLNLNEISSSCFAKHGKDYFIKRVIEEMDASDAPLMVVTGIRTSIDAQTLHDRYGDDFYLLHVFVSDDQLRLKRAIRRGSDRDPTSIEELILHDEREERNFGIDKATSLSRFTIPNNGTFRGLHNEVEDWVTKTFPDLKKK